MYIVEYSTPVLLWVSVRTGLFGMEGGKDTRILGEVNKKPTVLNLNWKFSHKLTYFIFKKRSISWFGPIKRLGDNGNHQNSECLNI